MSKKKSNRIYKKWNKIELNKAIKWNGKKLWNKKYEYWQII